MKNTALFIAGLCCLSAPCFAQETTAVNAAPNCAEYIDPSLLVLRFNVQPNTRYSTQTDIETQTATIFAGKQKTEVKQTLTFLMDTRVLAVGKNSVSMRLFFKGLRMKVQANDFVISYDSAIPPVLKQNPTTRQDMAQNSMAQVMGGFIGQSVDYTVSPDGKLVKITGLQATLNRMIARAKLPSKEETAQFKAAMTHLLKQAVGDGDRPNQTTGFYTGKALRIGDAWSQSQVTGGMLLPTQSELTYILKSRANGIATLALTGYSFDANKPAGRSSSMVSNGTVLGRQYGTMRIDENSGWPISVETEFRSTSEMDYMGDESMHIKTFSKGRVKMKNIAQ